MKISTAEQGTEQWFFDRAGVITASMFAGVRRRLKSGVDKGEYTIEARNYAFKLAIERIGKVNLDERPFSGWQAQRGRDLEEACRIRHEADINTLVDLAGFITTDCGRFGCSADSLVDDDGGGEYKCFLAADKLRSIIIEDDWSDVMDQAQGGIMIAEREWWDICLYCPALAKIGKDFIRKRTYRDDKYIESLRTDLLLFDEYVEECREKIVATAEKPPLPVVEEINQEEIEIVF